MADALGTKHQSVQVEDAEVGTLLPDVVEHSEAVLLRTAPGPLLKLSRLVRGHQTKVVLTGEGADEVFGGYDLFKEVKVRQFWARQPASTARPALLGRLYPYLALSKQSPQMVREFYGVGLEAPGALDFSHRIRWSNSGRISRFLSAGFLGSLQGYDPVAALLASVPESVRRWRPLARAQYLEVRTLLSQYLLSAQGDRMLMASSVEGRFPFLDHRLADFSARLPDWLKLRGLTEKFLLKRFAVGKVPAAVIDRHKFPYRAPVAEALAGAGAPAWSRELLTRSAVDAHGVFDGNKVEKLVAKLGKGGAAPSEADNMALIAIASTQLSGPPLPLAPATASGAPPGGAAGMSEASPFAFDWLFAHAGEAPQAPALGTPTHGWCSYGALAAQTAQLMGALREVGVAEGGFVVVTVPACATAVAAALAAQACGAAVADVSRELGKDALAEILRQTGAKVALAPGRDAALWAELARAAQLTHLFVVHAFPPSREAGGAAARRALELAA